MKNINDKQLAVEWIKRCQEDFASAKVELKETKNYTLVCFLCQQVAERYLKACLMSNQKDYPKSHDLIRLLNLVSEINKNILDYLEECRFLNPFYIDNRYPVFWGQPTTKKSAKQAIEYTESLIKFIRKLIKTKI